MYLQPARTLNNIVYWLLLLSSTNLKCSDISGTFSPNRFPHNDMSSCE